MQDICSRSYCAVHASDTFTMSFARYKVVITPWHSCVYYTTLSSCL